jgi:S1-C subfamily serine protease
LVLTTYHLISGEVAVYKREAGAIDSEVLCKGLRAEIAHQDESGNWVWVAASNVWLVSNTGVDRAIWDDEQGQSHLREDTAVLRLEPAPSSTLELTTEPARVGAPVWMAGFPLRSARSPSALAAIGYDDADGTLRVSRGEVTKVEPPDYLGTDIDGAMGNSGSPVFNDAGRVVGLFSRISGNGPKNAFEYGHLERVQVSIELAARGLQFSVPPL